MLSIIDSYERHLSELRCRELGLAIADDTHQSQTSVTDAEFTPNIKTVIRVNCFFTSSEHYVIVFYYTNLLKANRDFFVYFLHAVVLL